uniref:Cytochrome P450 n=1 Tax=Acrobeloides nanus TaxID=290746 RepID=A0A914CL09_9BILA
MEQLLATIFDLWMAGQETTSTTLAYSIVFLILNQDAQQKLQAELDKVVGNSRLVTLEDRPKLNYTIAVVNEAQRLANIIAINVRHTTLKDVEILGYKLPKGTTIVPQISVVMSDPKITVTSGKPPEVVRKLANTLAPPTFTCDIETRF